MLDRAETADDAEIARYEVSRDGVLWRDYDPARDQDVPLLHKRIVFAPLPDELIGAASSASSRRQ